MNSAALPLWVAVVAAVLAVLAAMLALLAMRRNPTHASSSWTQNVPSGRVVGETSVAIVLPAVGPIETLTFEQSLDAVKFADAAERQALAIARRVLGDLFPVDAEITRDLLLKLNAIVENAGDTLNFGLNSLRQIVGRPEMLVAPEGPAAAMLKAGRATLQQHAASGRRMPQIVDGDSKIVGIMKEVGTGRKALALAANATTLIVSAAHMISAADLARALKLVDGKLDLLLALRQVDQRARLERIFYEAQELLSAPLDEIRRHALWHVRGQLRELRISWRLEAEHHLERIENPADADWFARNFTFQSSKDEKVEQGISTGLAQLMLLEYSLRLDRVLATASGSWDQSIVSLRGELTSLERLADMVDAKVEFISTERRRAARPMTDGIRRIVEGYRRAIEPRASLFPH